MHILGHFPSFITLVFLNSRMKGSAQEYASVYISYVQQQIFADKSVSKEHTAFILCFEGGS
jgi:hypothetical protein